LINGFANTATGIGVTLTAADWELISGICVAQPEVCVAVGAGLTIYVAYKYLPSFIQAIENADKPTTIEADDCLIQYNKDRNACVQGPPGELMHCLKVAELNYIRCQNHQAPLPRPAR
jgi:hypothetical protein